MLKEIVNWQPYLQNEWVTLRPLQNADVTNLVVLASDPLIWEQHPAGKTYTRHDFEHYFEDGVFSGTAFAIIENASGALIGTTRFYDYKPEEPSIAIGYTFLARVYWGGKYNGACKELLLNYAFQRVENVYFHIAATNIRSQIATSKLGARKVGEMTFDLFGQKLPYFEYQINKQEWDEHIG